METRKVKKLSVLVPLYNEEDCLGAFFRRVADVLDSLYCEAEILMVNDGSTDRSLEIVKALQATDPRVTYLDLSRNFGKETAMGAGVDYISGDALVILDADLQDPPELIPQMLKLIEEGWDDVYGVRTKRRGESMLKKSTSRLYYYVLRHISDTPVEPGAGDFRMFSDKAIAALKEIDEKERNMKGLFSYLGFKKVGLPYERDRRSGGKTKWSLLKLLSLAMRGFKSSSKVPLRLVSLLGLVVSMISFVYMGVVFVKALVWGDPVSGYPSLMSVMLFLGGVELLALGVLGEYIGTIFTETKRRPGYFVNEFVKKKQ